MTAEDTIGPTIAEKSLPATGLPRHCTRGCRTVTETACFLWFFITLVLTFLPPAALAQENAATPVMIGTVSGQLDAPDAFGPFQEYLAQALPGYTFEVSGFDSIEGLMLAVENESLDFAFISPAAYVELTIDGNLRLLSTITQPVGETHLPWLAEAVFTLDSRNDIAAGEYIEIRVRDNVLGMSPGILQHIFEPFFTTKDNSGTGLVLSTVYGIVQEFMGMIGVTSTQGEGPEFLVLIPQTREAEESPASPGLVDSGTILVVEDQVEVLDYVTSVLRKSGYQVHTATSGKEAHAAMADLSEPVHLLITDVVMEGMNGGELAEIFSERYQDIPVLFILGYPGDELARYGFRQGMHELLAKPFNPQQLMERVDQILKNLRVTG